MSKIYFDGKLVLTSKAAAAGPPSQGEDRSGGLHHTRNSLFKSQGNLPRPLPAGARLADFPQELPNNAPYLLPL